MARKGWDALSDAYRGRLIRGGITESDYSQGASLARARGHVSERHEQFRKEVNAYVKRSEVQREDQRLKYAILHMGPVAGRKYMRDQRKMIELYESGETEKARQLWERRDQSQPDFLYWYHGRFA